MKAAIYPGTFEIFHDGHLHILKKALKIFDFVYVVVANNNQKKSSPLLLRYNQTKSILEAKNIKNIKIIMCENKLSDIAIELNVPFIIRGIRNKKDFLYEKFLYYRYKKDYNKYELIYFFSDEKFKNFSSKKILKNKK